MATSVRFEMMRWYRRYLALLTMIGNSRWPAIGWIWGLLLGSVGWTCYWLLEQQREGGALLLPLLFSLWLLIWLFIRLIFNFSAPTSTDQNAWKFKLRLGWHYVKFHGTAGLILLLILGCVLMSLKLASVLWRSLN